MYSEDIYKNPFIDYNANTMNYSQVNNLWENPFNTYLVQVSEDEFKNTKTPMIFTGGRGSGKTMLLKYFNVDSMKMRADSAKQSLAERIKEEKYIGTYIRFDGPQLKSMYDCGLQEIQWEEIFKHYLELVIAERFIVAVKPIINELDNNDKNNLINELEKTIKINTSEINLNEKYNNIIQQLDDDINYVTSFKARVVFGDKHFEPRVLFGAGQLSEKVVSIIGNTCFFNDDINYLLLIDEYENFLDYQQKIINSYLKFYNYFAYRIGMRPQGFHSYETVSEQEFLKEDRDYMNYPLETPLMGKQSLKGSYYSFLKGLAEKRLKSVPLFANKGLIDIKTFLGDKEDLVREAKNIVKGSKKHFTEYIKEIKKEYEKRKKTYTITDEQLKKLEDENPLYEIQNLHLLLKPYSFEYVLKAFEDYKAGITSEEAKKYKNDYDNKYKLSYVFILCSIYRVEYKLYYSFIDFAFLSSGIVGIFIELCRNAFQRAYYDAPDDLYVGSISPEIQTLAAIDVANSEFRQINKIYKYGNRLSLLAKNIGDIFRKRHIDRRIKYPETNQFTILINNDDNVKALINSALQWSVFQRKTNLQQASISKPIDIIYTLNKIYAPVFQISIRTRGGYNERFTNIEIVKMAQEVIAVIEDDEDMKNIDGYTSLGYHQISLEEFNYNHE